MQSTINNLQKENEKLKRKTIDPTKFEEWNEDDVINWIFSLENGLFEQSYGDILSKEIKNAELSGSDLIELNTNDMKMFGINKFKHKKILEKHIQKLVQQNHTKNQDVMNNDNEGVNAPTAYI